MATYAHSVKVKPDSVPGGVQFIIGKGTKVSDDQPDAYARAIIQENSHPRGAIIERAEARSFRSALSLGPEHVVLAYWDRDSQKRSYVLLSPSPIGPSPSA